MSKELSDLASELNLVVLPSTLWAVHVDPNKEFIAFSHVTANKEKVVIDKGVLLTHHENNKFKSSISINDEIVDFAELPSIIQQVSDISFLLSNLEHVRICTNANLGLSHCARYILNNDNNLCDECIFKVFSEEDVPSISSQATLEFAGSLLLETDLGDPAYDLLKSDVVQTTDGKADNIEYINHYLCTFCGSRFASPSDLDLHLCTHSNERPFKCNVCDKTFTKRYNLNVHLRVHSGEKPYVCSKCGKTFATRSNITTHMKGFHLEEKKHSCKICNMNFVYPRVLRIHMRKHTGEKPFSCNICDKVFSKKVHLTTHLRTHTGEKPFVCTICNKGFTTSGNLSAHKKSNHKSK